MLNSFLNWTSRVAIAERVAEQRRSESWHELTIPGTTRPSARLKPRQKPQSGSGKLISSD
jgi:hypothetical protein